MAARIATLTAADLLAMQSMLPVELGSCDSLQDSQLFPQVLRHAMVKID